MGTNICDCCGVNIATNSCDCCDKDICRDCYHHFHERFGYPEGYACCECVRLECENRIIYE